MREHLRAVFLGLSFLLSSLACSPTAPGETSLATHSSVAEYVSLGDLYADQGESVRAEQYYLAAKQLGAEEEFIFSRLLQTCISGGRLGSAVSYAEERLKNRPEDEVLLRLSASLREALGHYDLSLTYVRELERLQKPSAETLLFIAEFFEGRAASEEALGAFEAYLKRAPAAEVPPWVLGSVRRLEERASAEALALREGGK